MRYECNEVLNDLVNYFLLADIRLLKKFKDDNDLADDLATEFTRNESGDKAVLEGVLIPMTGVENYPYTIIFTLPAETPELLKAENNLQHRRAGYTLRVEHGQVQLFTWRILDDFNDESINALLQRYEAPNRPHIALENGTYSVEILAGEVFREDDYQPAFEFVLEKNDDAKPAADLDINYLFSVDSQSY